MKVAHKQSCWVVTWPKGTTETYFEEPWPSRPTDYAPISAETLQRFEYRTGRRQLYGACIAVFETKAEAKAWMRTQSDCWTLRKATLLVH